MREREKRLVLLCVSAFVFVLSLKTHLVSVIDEGQAEEWKTKLAGQLHIHVLRSKFACLNNNRNCFHSSFFLILFFFFNGISKKNSRDQESCVFSRSLTTMWT